MNAEVINFNWTWSGNGSWVASQAWTPGYDDQLGGIGGSNWNNLTRFDRVTISQYTVTSTSEISFRSANRTAATDKTGTFNAISLINGGNLIVNNAAGLSISTSAGGYVRGALIGSGSTLEVQGVLRTGAQDATNSVSLWTIEGTVKASTFRGQQGSGFISGNPDITGGYILNLNGGRMEVGTFDWRTDQGMGAHGNETIASGSSISTAIVNLSEGGILIADTMTANWIDSSNAFVNFVDGSGSLTFGKTNFSQSSDVQSLIDGNYIRKTTGGVFNIADNGATWTVTVVPEPASVMAVMACVTLGLVASRRLLRARH